jgi:hypothetical protein
LTVFTGRFAALTRALQSSRARAALVALAFAILSGCGKKGPPLAPFSSSPAAPPEVTVRRKGDQVEIHFKVPVSNSDGRRPAKIDHVEAYALTMPGEKVQGEGKEGQEGKGGKRGHGGKSEGGTGGRSGGTSGGMSGIGMPPGAPGAHSGPGASHDQPFRKYGTVVGSVLVRKPPPKPKEPKEGEPPPPPPPPRTDPGLDQGDAAVIVDTLTAASLTPVEIPEKELTGSTHPHEGDHTHEAPDAKSGKNALRAHVTPPDLGPPLPLPSLRYYSLAGTNGKRKGVFAQAIAVPLEDLPPAPPAPVVTVAEGHIQVVLALPVDAGLRHPVIRSASPPVAPAVPPPVTTAPATPDSETEEPAAPEAPVAAPPTTTVAPAAPATAAPSAPAPATATPAPATATPGEDQELPPCTPVPTAPAQAAATAPTQAGATSPTQTGAISPAQAGATSPAQAAPVDQPGAPGAQSVPPPCAPTTVLPAKLIFTYPSPLYAFMVYEMPPPDFTPPRQEPGAVPQYPALLTPAPVLEGTWSDPRFVVGADRCYVARLVMTVGQITSESAPSPTVCVKTVDTFPPAAPKNVQAVASEGTISLIWDANTEADLLGYIVLRGAAGSDKLTAITPTPIKETTFRDTKVRGGARYVYVVVAVDTATPQNVSAQSNRVEETAR